MLVIPGQFGQDTCDGYSRRELLRIGVERHAQAIRHQRIETPKLSPIFHPLWIFQEIKQQSPGGYPSETPLRASRPDQVISIQDLARARAAIDIIAQKHLDCSSRRMRGKVAVDFLNSRSSRSVRPCTSPMA